VQTFCYIKQNKANAMLSNRLSKTIVYASRLRHLSAISSASLKNCLQKSRYTVLPASSSLPTRYYSDDNQQHYQLPPLTDGRPIIYPNFFKTIKGFIQMHFVIRPHIDQDFSMQEFIEGAKYAMCSVSKALASEDYESLQGLVTNDVINTLRNKINTLSNEQKQLISVAEDDVTGMFPYEVGIIFDDNKAEEKFIEITVISYIIKNRKNLTEEVDSTAVISTDEELKRRSFITNYRFIREYSKKSDNAWTINYINHFMPDNCK